jgi:hypothetical protein
MQNAYNRAVARLEWRSAVFALLPVRGAAFRTAIIMSNFRAQRSVASYYQSKPGIAFACAAWRRSGEGALGSPRKVAVQGLAHRQRFDEIGG